ncbi:MAG: hypothetical protein WB992_18380 [Bryobacteraceae bacterium]
MLIGHHRVVNPSGVVGNTNLVEDNRILPSRRKPTVVSTFGPCSRSRGVRGTASTAVVKLCNADVIMLPKEKLQRLREIRELLKTDAAVEEREQYLQVFDKIKQVYKAAHEGFRQPLKITFGDDGWVTFKCAMELRNGVTARTEQTPGVGNTQMTKDSSAPRSLRLRLRMIRQLQALDCALVGLPV